MPKKNNKKKISNIFIYFFKEFVPCRFYLGVLLITFLGINIGKYLNQSYENNYFSILGTILQSYLTLLGILIAMVIFFFDKESKQKVNDLKLFRRFLMPLVTSAITVLYVLIGFLIFTSLKMFNQTGGFLLNSILFAIWSFIETFSAMVKLIALKR